MDLDSDTKQELMDSFYEHAEEIEHALARLELSPDSKVDILNEIFRSIHSIKGNAGMVQLGAIVDFAHSIENVTDALRHESYPPSHAVCEAIQLGMDRLRDIHEREVLEKTFENIREQELAELFNYLAQSSSDNACERANTILKFMSTGLGIENKYLSETPETGNLFSVIVDDDKRQSDLSFFQEMAQQIENQSQYWKGRSAQQLEWVLKLNNIGGNPVNYEQLAAAVYLHDIGMSLIPNSIINKPDKLLPEEIELIRKHPLWGYNYLVRIPGWEDAANIILDHHERVDGKGYPNSKTDSDIHPGSKILSIIDTFFSFLSGRADRTKRQSVLRAVSEINACSNTQFDGMWVQCFNHMVRSEVKGGHL